MLDEDEKSNQKKVRKPLTEEELEWIAEEYKNDPNLKLYEELDGEDFIDLYDYIVDDTVRD